MMPSRKSATQHPWHYLLVVALLVAAQWLATAHAVAHPFHDYDASCAVYFAADAPPLDSGDQFVVHSHIADTGVPVKPVAFIPRSGPLTHYPSRAPPQLS